MHFLKTNSLWATVFSLFIVVMAFDLGSIAAANRQTADILRVNNRITLSNVSAETGQRGYLLTGDLTYLTPYENAENTLADDLSLLKSLDKEDANKIDLLIYLVDEKHKEMDSTIKAYKEGGFEPAVSIVRNNSGKYYMDQIRFICNNIAVTHRNEFDLELDKLNFRIKTSYYMLSLSFLLTIFGTALDGLHLLKGRKN